MRRVRNGATDIEQERRCWELRLEGQSYAQIAGELGISQTSVLRSLRRARDAARKEWGEELFVQQQLRLAQLDALLREAVAAWQESKGEEVTTTETRSRSARSAETSGEGEPPVAQVVRQRRRTAGDCAYLDRAFTAIAQARELLGLDAPKRVQVEAPMEPMKLYAGFDLDRV
jgi:hypothetical protein